MRLKKLSSHRLHFYKTLIHKIMASLTVKSSDDTIKAIVWLLPPEQRTNAMLIDVIDTVSQKKCYDWLIFYSIGSLEAAADECRMNILYYTFDMIQSLCVFTV